MYEKVFRNKISHCVDDVKFKKIQEGLILILIGRLL